MILGIDAWVVWLALAIIMLLVESTTISLVPIWFACGSLVAVVLDWFGLSVGVQVAAMLASSAMLLSVSMFVIRPRLHQSGESAIPSTEFLGQEGIVVDRIDPSSGVGLIFLCGQTWSAGSESGDVIEKDTHVRVIMIRGQKAIVRPLEAEPVEEIQPSLADGVPETAKTPEPPAGPRKDLSAETRQTPTISG